MACPMACGWPGGECIVTPSSDSAAGRNVESLVRRRRRRVVYSLVAIALVLAIGTVGFYALTGAGWIDAFYFESMLATGQGPPFALSSSGAKLFASLMAFISVGTVLTSLIVNLGPMLGRLWREGIAEAEHEIHKFEREVSEELREH